MDGSNKKQKITSVDGVVEKLGPSYTVHGNVNGAATMENSMAGPKKTRDRIIT